jgi:hypothetical protein
VSESKYSKREAGVRFGGIGEDDVITDINPLVLAKFTLATVAVYVLSVFIFGARGGIVP